MGLFDRFKKESASKQIIEVKKDSDINPFLNRLSELQTDMISICDEYAEGLEDKIFIHGFLSDDMVRGDYMYEVNGKLVKRYKMDEATNGKVDTSVDRQKQCIAIVNQDLAEFIQALKGARQRIPYEIRIIYDAKKKSVDGKYNYPPLPDGVKEEACLNLSDLWFEELGYPKDREKE